MAKTDHTPPFRMIVENGRLVPGAAWEAERLATFRNGSEVNVVITQEVASWRRRKYWAILGTVVKTCPVPQKRAEDLHKAIRLKLGIVDSFTTIGGGLKVELRSTSTMDEQEFEAYYLEAMELLRQITGVDPETLGKEAADVGHPKPETQSSAPPAPTDADEGSGTLTSPEPAPASISSAVDTKAAIVAGFLTTATTPGLSTPQERRESLEMSKDMWKDRINDGEFGDNPEALVTFLATAWKTVDDVIRGRKPLDDAKTYLEGLIR